MGDNGANTLDFPQEPSGFRKQHSLNQAKLAQRIGIHVVQLQHYQAGNSQPIRDGRPDDEANPRFDEKNKRIVHSLLEGMILKHEARRWRAVSNSDERKDRQ